MYGVNLRCNPGEVVQGQCSSGAYADCSTSGLHQDGSRSIYELYQYSGIYCCEAQDK